MIKDVGRSYGFLLVALGAIWGSSYLFIKVAVRDLSPAAMMELRVLLAAAVLVPFVALRSGRGGLRELRAAWRAAIPLGLANAALPFTLIAWGERYVDSGVAAVANASVPIFVALLALKLAPDERATGLRLAGILLGLVGVAVLAGVHPRGGWWGAAGTGAVIVASVSYAWSNLYMQRKIAVGGPVLAAASMSAAVVLLFPFALASLPSHAPGAKALGSVAMLGLLGTGLAQLLLYRMIGLHGPSRTSLVAYLLPGFALVYGISFLGEPLTVPEIAGFALILGGVALGSGVVRLPRRAAVAQP